MGRPRTKSQQDTAAPLAFELPSADATEAVEPSTEPILEPTNGQQVFSGMTQRDTDSSAVAPRLTVPIKPDGTLDFASMREATKAKLRVAFTDAGMPMALGIVSSAVSTELLSDTDVAEMYSALSQVEQMLAVSGLIGLPKDIAQRIFTYSRDELAVLVPPTKRILNKYSPVFLSRWKDEIVLGTLMLVIHRQKMEQVAAILKAQQTSIPSETFPQSSARVS